jgi:hypothetical protein
MHEWHNLNPFAQARLTVNLGRNALDYLNRVFREPTVHDLIIQEIRDFKASVLKPMSGANQPNRRDFRIAPEMEQQLDEGEEQQLQELLDRGQEVIRLNGIQLKLMRRHWTFLKGLNEQMLRSI